MQRWDWVAFDEFWNQAQLLAFTNLWRGKLLASCYVFGQISGSNAGNWIARKKIVYHLIFVKERNQKAIPTSAGALWIYICDIFLKRISRWKDFIHRCGNLILIIRWLRFMHKSNILRFESVNFDDLSMQWSLLLL